MTKPDITIKGFHGMSYADAVECGEMTKRTMIRELLKAVEDGQLYAEATLCSTGDTVMLLIKNKRSGQHEIYDLQVRAHYFEEGSPCCGTFIAPAGHCSKCGQKAR